MDPRLLHYYNQELQHLREMGKEFAEQFPKIAARLGMEGIEVADPYVERLLEGCAFLAARVKLKLDAEFPRFTQRLLEIVYPNLLAPLPSMLVARLHPDLNDPGLARGVILPRGTAMRSALVGGEQTACEYRTAHDLTLWPLRIEAAEYFSYAPDLPLAGLAIGNRVRGGIRLRLHTTAGLACKQLALDRLCIYFAGADETAYKLHALSLGACLGILVGPPGRPMPWREFIPAAQVLPVGFSDEQALLPVSLRGFQGYRLLQEYFAFPQRFLFVELNGLAPAFRRHDGEELEIVLLFERGEQGLESIVDTNNFALFCTPAINLFPRRADRIQLSEGAHEYHVVADRTRPMDFEIFDVAEVRGFGVGADSEQVFLPFYAASHPEPAEHAAYYMIQREPRRLSANQKRGGARTSYIGAEVFLSLVDPEEAPYRSDLRQLAVAVRCSNRDLPLLMPLGAGKTDFTLDAAAPVQSIRCLKGPSKPVSPLRDGARAWLAVNHLSLNYLSLIDNDARTGAAALREMLELHAMGSDHAGMNRQIEGVRSVRTQAVVRRLPMPGPIACGRGLEITLEVDELAFQGGSTFLFGAVMEHFFARHVSINAFTETVLRSSTRGEIMRWAPRSGERAIL